MKDTTRKFDCRVADLPVLAGFLKESYRRDQADFEQYSPDFNAGYLSRLEQLLLEAEALVSPVQLTKELKAVNLHLRQSMDALKPLLNRLEGYALRAAGLTVAAGDFGFRAVRRGISASNPEDTMAALKVLLQHVNANFAALQAKGYSEEARAALVALQTAIKHSNQTGNRLLDSRELQVQNNLKTLNALWDVITDICNTGKRLYKGADPVRTRDYTLSHLQTRIRQERETTPTVPVTA